MDEDDGVDAALMEICAAAMFLVHASPSDLAVGEDGIADEDETAVVEMIEALLPLVWMWFGGSG